MSSFRYFRWSKDEAPVERSLVPRKLFTAMGEVTIADDAGVLEFSEFCVRYVNDGQFRRWFAELDAFLAAVCDDPYRWDRLICAGANLRALIWVLRGTVVPKSQADLANLDGSSIRRSGRSWKATWPASEGEALRWPPG